MTLPFSATRTAMALGVLVSWASMLAHNVYELPISVLALENTGPLAVAAALLAAHLVWPRSMVPALALFAWAALNLVVGGILSVLPLSLFPFEPEQSLTHYAAHAVYSIGQIPLLAISLAALRGRRAIDEGRP